MWIKTLALPLAMSVACGLAGCAGMGLDDTGLAGGGFGEDPWRETRAAKSSIVLPVTQTGAGIAVIRQGLARARAAEARAAGGIPRLTEAAVDAQPAWHPAGEAATGSTPARQGDDTPRSNWGPQPQRAKG